MSQIVAFHSARGGADESTISASVASLMAFDGKRVGIVASGMRSPCMPALFGLHEDQITHTLSDYLAGCCEIRQTAYDVSVSLGSDVPGAVFVMPSAREAGDLARLLDEEHGMMRLSHGVRRLVWDLQLDTLIIDTDPGLVRETVVFMALCDALAIVLRPNQQEYEDTGLAVAVARTLGVPHLRLIVDNVPSFFDLHQVRSCVERTYNCAVAAVLPQSDELPAPAGAGIFAHCYPQHPVTAALRTVAGVLGQLGSGLSASLPLSCS